MRGDVALLHVKGHRQDNPGHGEHGDQRTGGRRQATRHEEAARAAARRASEPLDHLQGGTVLREFYRSVRGRCAIGDIPRRRRELEDCLSPVSRPAVDRAVPVLDWRECLWVAIFGRQSRFDIRVGSAQSPVRAAFNGTRGCSRRRVDAESAELLVQRQLEHTALRKSAGAHWYNALVPVESAEDVSSRGAILAFENNGTFPYYYLLFYQ